LIQIVTIHRRHVLAGLLSGLAGASPALAGASQAHIPTVLFVCQFGSVKSSAAREIFKRRAAARGIAVNVFSRGITPEAHASPALKARLATEGIDLDAQPLTRLAPGDLQAANIVVIFDPLPRDLARPDARDWTQTPSFNENYDQARAYLDPRIDALLDEINAAAHR